MVQEKFKGLYDILTDSANVCAPEEDRRRNEKTQRIVRQVELVRKHNQLFVAYGTIDRLSGFQLAQYGFSERDVNNLTSEGVLQNSDNFYSLNSDMLAFVRGDWRFSFAPQTHKA